jgi:hypothetical protein
MTRGRATDSARESSRPRRVDGGERCRPGQADQLQNTPELHLDLDPRGRLLVGVGLWNYAEPHGAYPRARLRGDALLADGFE